MGDMRAERAGVQQLLLQDEGFAEAWIMWEGWVRSDWELYNVPEQEVLTEDDKAKLLQEEQSLTSELRAREDRISELNGEMRDATQNKDIPRVSTLNTKIYEANQGMDTLRQKIEDKRRQRLGLQENERVLNEEDEKWQQIIETCHQRRLSPLQIENVKTEVLRAYDEQRDYDSSTLVAHPMPWDPVTDRVIPPKRIVEVMYQALCQARGRADAPR